jgi:hypothetical protein
LNVNGLATRWNVFETTSLAAAIEPVAIAMCAAAVSDGAIVIFCCAEKPFARSRLIPSFGLSWPLALS